MSEKIVKRLLTVAGSLFTVAFCLAPFLYMLLVSLARRPDFLSPGTAFEFTLENYRRVLAAGTHPFLRYLFNSLFVSLVSAAAAVLIAASAAYALTRLRLPGRGAVLVSVLAVSLLPQVSLVGFLFILMSRLGWINTYPALIFPYIAWLLPLALWITVSYFARLPRALDRAALVDGCSHRQVLTRVIFPVAVPGLFSVFLLGFILAFNEFLFALMLTTDYHARTAPIGIALFQGLHGRIPWGTIMAASTVSILSVILLTVIFQRKITEGLTLGAVKE